MELKYFSDEKTVIKDTTFNRTAYGIEMYISRSASNVVSLLIAPLMELKSVFQLRNRHGSEAFNRTAYGIEIEHPNKVVIDQILLLIAPLMELK